MTRSSIYAGFNGRSQRFISDMRYQARRAKAAGARKCLGKASMVVMLVLVTIPLLLIRLIRPIFVVRFARLYSHSIGPFCAITDIYLCERRAGMHGSRVLDLFCHSSPVCNQQLKKMWNHRLHVYPFVDPLIRLNAIIPGGKAHQVPWHLERDIHRLLSITPPPISFTSAEERRGATKLRDLGVLEGSPFVCFHARDSAYLDTAFPEKDLTNNDYRDSSIQNYVPAAEALAHRGYFALRMGAIVKESLHSTHSNVIDYATTGRTDFLDMYLGDKCRFWIVSATGIHSIPMLFRRPIVLVNLIPLVSEIEAMPGQLIIPKRLWLRDEQRFLTISEQLQLEKVWDGENSQVLFGFQYGRSGIDVIENTADEITAVALEMDERLKGTWETTQEDEVLQDRFWSLFEEGGLKSEGEYLTRVGAEFLRQNRECLG